MIYFVSDTHFGHTNVLKFERFNFHSIAEHDNYIMTCIEERIHEGDTLYFLGDFMFGYYEDIIRRWKAMPCRKIAIKGNHDRMSLLEECFDEVHSYPLFLNNRILLSHEPEQCSPYVLNVHGHLHGANLDSPNHLNVNISMTGYNMYSMKAVNKRLGELPERNNAFLHEWYADKYVFTVQRDDIVTDDDGKVKLEETLKVQDNRLVTKYFVNEYGEEECRKVKALYKRMNMTVYVDEDGENLVGVWENREETIYPCIVHKKEGKAYDQRFNRWDKCWVNGKKMAKMFPKSKASEKYEVLWLEVMNDDDGEW